MYKTLIVTNLSISLFFISCSAVKQKNKTLYKNREELFDNYYKRYSDSHDKLVEMLNHLPLAKKVKQEIEPQKMLKRLNNSQPKQCFDSIDRKFKDNNQLCLDSAYECGRIWNFQPSDSEMFIEVLENDFSISKIELNSYESFLKNYPGYSTIKALQSTSFNKFLDLFTEYSFNYCSTINAAGIIFSEGKVIIPQTLIDEINNTASIEDSFVKCSNFFHNLDHAKIKDYNKAYINKQFSTYQTKCEKLAQAFCTNSRFIQNEFVYSYQTIGCKVRDVTIYDIEKEITNWKNNSYMTRASILKHKELLATIKACEKAHQIFNIKYEPIDLNEICKKTKQ